MPVPPAPPLWTVSPKRSITSAFPPPLLSCSATRAKSRVLNGLDNCIEHSRKSATRNNALTRENITKIYRRYCSVSAAEQPPTKVFLDSHRVVVPIVGYLSLRRPLRISDTTSAAACSPQRKISLRPAKQWGVASDPSPRQVPRSERLLLPSVRLAASPASPARQ